MHVPKKVIKYFQEAYALALKKIVRDNEVQEPTLCRDNFVTLFFQLPKKLRKKCCIPSLVHHCMLCKFVQLCWKYDKYLLINESITDFIRNRDNLVHFLLSFRDNLVTKRQRCVLWKCKETTFLFCSVCVKYSCKSYHKPKWKKNVKKMFWNLS